MTWEPLPVLAVWTVLAFFFVLRQNHATIPEITAVPIPPNKNSQFERSQSMLRFLRSLRFSRSRRVQDANAGDNSIIVQSLRDTNVSLRPPRKEGDFDVFFLDAPNSTELFYLLPFGGKKIFLVPFTLGVMNNTPYTIENAELMIDIPHYIYREDMFSRTMSRISSARGGNYISDPIDGTKRYMQYIKFPPIPPATVGSTDGDYLVFNGPTELDSKGHAAAQNGTPVQFTFSVSFAWGIGLRLNIADVKTINKTISVSSVKCSRKGEARQVRRDICKEKGKDLSRRAYIYFERFVGAKDVENARSDLRELYKKGGAARCGAIKRFVESNGIESLPVKEQEKRLFSYFQERFLYCKIPRVIYARRKDSC